MPTHFAGGQWQVLYTYILRTYVYVLYACEYVGMYVHDNVCTYIIIPEHAQYVRTYVFRLLHTHVRTYVYVCAF